MRHNVWRSASECYFLINLYASVTLRPMSSRHWLRSLCATHWINRPIRRSTLDGTTFKSNCHRIWSFFCWIGILWEKFSYSVTRNLREVFSIGVQSIECNELELAQKHWKFRNFYLKYLTRSHTIYPDLIQNTNKFFHFTHKFMLYFEDNSSVLWIKWKFWTHFMQLSTEKRIKWPKIAWNYFI